MVEVWGGKKVVDVRVERVVLKVFVVEPLH